VASLSRRTFLTHSTAAVAAAGVVAALPAAAATAAGLTGTEAAAAAGRDDLAASSTPSEPVVAHVRNAKTGEISIYTGTRTITVRDPSLAARLVKAAR